ncbi:HAMP domain-containing protein [Vaginella massiliensis]|nr:HAMP domain-containing protein [Vaginella massiliensis]
MFKTIVVIFVIFILVIYVAGRFFFRKAFESVKEMTEKARIISATNLDLRLPSNGNKDELSQLVNTFNEKAKPIR